jgi:sugar phosphate isomerase/epimerase
MARNRPIVALQLYTVRDAVAQDMIGTLRRVAEMGYEGIELAGAGNATIEEIATALRELNLRCVGGHTPIDALQSDLDSAIQSAGWLGNRHVVCPYIGEEWRSAEGYKKLAGILSNVGAQLKREGLQMCYHNHAFEFEKYDGEYGLDILLGSAEPELLHAEIDTFWVQKGGEEPGAYIEKYEKRAPLIHLKDMTEGGDFAPVGEGTINWDPVFEICDNSAVAYIVEQDRCDGDPFDSVQASITNLRRWGKLD